MHDSVVVLTRCRASQLLNDVVSRKNGERKVNAQQRSINISTILTVPSCRFDLIILVASSETTTRTTTTTKRF